MLQLIAGLIFLVELPAWALMIFRPKQDMTRHLISNYLIFVPLGLLFVFLGVGLAAGEAGLLATVSSALNSGDAAAATDALKAVQTGLPTLGLVAIAAMSVMDLAGGHVIYIELQKRPVPELAAGFFLVLTYLTGPIGMFIFVSWRYLTAIQQPQPTATNTVAISGTSQPSA